MKINNPILNYRKILSECFIEYREEEDERMKDDLIPMFSININDIKEIFRQRTGRRIKDWNLVSITFDNNVVIYNQE